MSIKVGDKFPQGTLAFYESKSLKTIQIDEILRNKIDNFLDFSSIMNKQKYTFKFL